MNLTYFTFILLYLVFTTQAFAQELRDVKAPVAYPSSVVSILMVVILLIGIVLLIMLLFRRLRQAMTHEEIVLKPWEKALKQLGHLEQKDLLAQERYDEFYSVLSDVLRKYIEEQFSIRAPEMTTEEFLQYLRKSSELNPQQKQSLGQFMESSDLVKFAKYRPDPSEAMQGFRLAKQFIEETHPRQERAVSS